MKVLVTGGAGFIGGHLVDALVAGGHEVVVLDALLPQVHRGRAWPAYINSGVAAYVEGSTTSPRVVRAVLQAHDPDVVYDLAAAVGVGQSMYEVGHYVATNDHGTAVLLDEVAGLAAGSRLRRLVVASSMSIYGEGARDADGVGAAPTPEDHPTTAPSVYGLTKLQQERLTLTVAAAYGIPAVALRFFNCYGARQALSNPYTGVCAIFATDLLQGRQPTIYEDGLQTRDFIHVDDIVAALLLAGDEAAGLEGAYNVGTGVATSVLDVADLLARDIAPGIRPNVTGVRRAGDIRHCVADSSRLRAAGWEPRVALSDGIRDLVAWVREQEGVPAPADAHGELERRGLVA